MGRGIATVTAALALALASPAAAEVRGAEGPVAETWFSGTASVVADKFEAARADATYRLRGSASAEHKVRIVFWACGPVSCDAVKSIETDVRRGTFDRA